MAVILQNIIIIFPTQALAFDFFNENSLGQVPCMSFGRFDGLKKMVSDSDIFHFHVTALVSRDKSFLRRKDSRVIMLSIFFFYLLLVSFTKTSLVFTTPPCLFLTTTLVNKSWILLERCSSLRF